MEGREVVIVGAGPGGLAAGMLLARRGLRVTLYEREAVVGGRCRAIHVGDYTFDLGPTFLMMKFILDKVFEEAGHASGDHLRFTLLDPMYRLVMPGGVLDVVNDPSVLQERLERAFPGVRMAYHDFMRAEKDRFDALYPCLEKDYSRFRMMLNPTLLKALPRFDLGKSLYDVLGRYFEPPYGRVSFSFQSKYLGMSPWECPAAFAIIPYIEHAFGIYHVEGGLAAITEAMARVFEAEGGTLRAGTPVARLLVEGGRARGVVLEDGEVHRADHVVIGADFGHAMTAIVPEEHRGRYTRERLLQKGWSCSTYMLYLALDTQYPLVHHTIVFAEDYQRNITDVAEHRIPHGNSSYYIRNSCFTDPTVAPGGHSTLYVLVPTPNNKSGADWDVEGPRLRDWVVGDMKRRLDLPDLEDHVVAERVVTPTQWEEEQGVFIGATFNLAHSLGQMLWFRPHNTGDPLPGCYLVGGGTHPGSGLPTILESARISSRALCRDAGVRF